ncbi:hypothetical protein SMSP2_01824 [Limihaloglobus sulfuriphilus]|uniref:Uncharacterized protein n=1 Tax=Limihaloglobus sulfuriphilus TaxID=1851148 RepID=A0A1Q2MFK5_9BACT|nr:hypothetical protein [Limihaloglobus sulfuriphilus]AQQ71450.1 hypothetical protein SMSP2_01824 [Limihaloglobus sulfuriphilus]
MNPTKHKLFAGALATAVAVTLFTSCAAKDDAVSEAKKSGKVRPGIAEIKAIAEEGFIYGLPIVMNYAVMQEFSVDTNSGQFKAPFNTMWNDAASLHTICRGVAYKSVQFFRKEI